MTLRHGPSGPEAPFVGSLFFDVSLLTSLAVDTPKDMFESTGSNVAGLRVPPGGMTISAWAPICIGDLGVAPIAGSVEITLEKLEPGGGWETIKTSTFTGKPDIYDMTPESVGVTLPEDTRIRTRAVVRGAQLTENSHASATLYFQ